MTYNPTLRVIADAIADSENERYVAFLNPDNNEKTNKIIIDSGAQAKAAIKTFFNCDEGIAIITALEFYENRDRKEGIGSHANPASSALTVLVSFIEKCKK